MSFNKNTKVILSKVRLFVFLFLPLIFAIGFNFSLTKDANADVIAGGDSGTIDGGCGGGSNCYSGNYWVHFTFKNDDTSSTKVGGGWGNFSGVTGNTEGNDVSDCNDEKYGKGVYFYMYRTTTYDGENKHYAFGSAPAKLGHDTCSGNNCTHTDTSDGVLNGNYDPARLRLDGIGYSQDEVEEAYSLYRGSGDPSTESFFASDKTWFCGAEVAKEKNVVFSGNSSASWSFYNKLTHELDGDLYSISAEGYPSVKINNAHRNPLTGEWYYYYPYSEYKYIFSHELSWAKGDPWGEFSLDYAKTKWKIEESYDGGATWNDIYPYRYTEMSPGFAMNNSDNTQRVNITTGISVQNESNRGTITMVCQRITYYSSVQYSSTGSMSYNSVIESSDPACVEIKNPNWEEQEGAPFYHEITVSGKPTEIHLFDETGNDTDVVKNRGTYQEVLSYGLSAQFDHELVRKDSGYDENDSHNSVPFYPSNGSIANFSITTKFNGVESSPGSNISLKPLGATNSYLDITFEDPNTSWNSSLTQGRTTTEFNAGETFADATYSILADQTKTVCHKTYNTPTKWAVKYSNIQRRDTYLKPDGSLVTGGWETDRTELASTHPEAYESPASYISDKLCENLYRPWNYEVLEISPQAIYSTPVISAGQNLAQTFNVEVERPESDHNEHRFITDVNSKITVITYIIKSDIDDTDIIEAKTKGKKDYSGIKYCDFFSGILDTNVSDNCNTYEWQSESGASGLPRYNSNKVYSGTDYASSLAVEAVTPNAPIGDKFCIAIAFDQYSSAKTGSFISPSTCSNISKNPTMHVLGGSVSALSGGAKTSVTKNIDASGAELFYGSWVDLSVIANKEVYNLASGAALISGVESGNFPCNIFPLSIANQNCSSEKISGKARVNSSVSLFSKYFARYCSGATLSDYTISTEISIVDNDDSQILCANNVTIESDIKIGDGEIYNNYKLPQVYIIANGDISIYDDVSRVDAWLISSGIINTCSNVDNDSLSADTCKKPLTLNAPLVADKVEFRRTYGADYHSGSLATAAEEIDFSPSAIIDSFYRAKNDTLPRTVYLEEIAPRY